MGRALRSRRPLRDSNCETCVDTIELEMQLGGLYGDYDEMLLTDYSSCMLLRNTNFLLSPDSQLDKPFSRDILTPRKMRRNSNC
jgi:hypothetical protein